MKLKILILIITVLGVCTVVLSSILVIDRVTANSRVLAEAKEHDDSKDYALVHDIGVSATDYLGKTVQVTGLYHNSLTQSDGTQAEPKEDEIVYHFLTVFDEPGCCSRTIEFVSADGKYPSFGDEVYISGVLARYKEGNNEYLTVDKCTWAIVTPSPVTSTPSSSSGTSSSSSSDISSDSSDSSSSGSSDTSSDNSSSSE